MKVPIYASLAVVVVPISVVSAWAPYAATQSLHLTALSQENSVESVIARSSSVGDLTTESEVISAPITETNSESRIQTTSSNLIQNEKIKSVATVVCSTLLTYSLNNIVSVGPIRAASVVGSAAAMALPEKLALAALCGAFAGMARAAVIPGLPGALILGGVCAAMMALFDRKKWMVGVGGRLGFIAQCACTSQFLISSLFSVPSNSARLIGSFPNIVALFAQLPSVCFFTVFGALFMSFCKEVVSSKWGNGAKSGLLVPLRKGMATPVGAVGLTGMVASLLPPAVAGPTFCGSFIAMSSPAKLETYGALVLASLLAGVSQQMLSGLMLGGWGGKLGTAALMGVILYEIAIAGRSRMEVSVEKKMANADIPLTASI